MDSPIKHHYVPQCYLKKFSLDKVNIKYYDKELCCCCNKEINKICQTPNLYTLSQSNDPYYIETMFFANDNERKLGKQLVLFDNINDKSTTILYDKAQRKILAKQIVLQYVRTPKYRDTKSEYELKAYYDQIILLLNKINFNVDEIKFEANNKAEFHKTLLLNNMEDIILDIADCDWELLYTSSGEFYTSDNPVTIKAREDMPVTYCDAIEFFSEILYPLNPKLMLHIIARPNTSNKKINIRVCNEEELQMINKQIKRKAVKYVIYTHKFS